MNITDYLDQPTQLDRPQFEHKSRHAGSTRSRTVYISAETYWKLRQIIVMERKTAPDASIDALADKWLSDRLNTEYAVLSQIWQRRTACDKEAQEALAEKAKI